MTESLDHNPAEKSFLARRAMQKLNAWKNAPKRSALCVVGARQIGKTTLIRHFARLNYENFVELNFVTEPRAKAIFEGSLHADAVITSLSAFVRKPLIPGKTLIFFDEIQECPQARSAIKFLVEDGRFDYIESGSLLGVKTKEISSLPVGFETQIMMYPLDFEEFCASCGVQPDTFDYLRQCFETMTPVADAVHTAMLQLFYAYMVVGGMPQCVTTYLDTHDIGQVLAVQRDILALYRIDIARYAEREKAKVRDIFDAIPSQLEAKNRRFILSSLSSTARQERYESAFIWLSDAGVALPCFNVTQPVSPLALSEKRNLFKLFMCDTGLLAAASMQNIQFDILRGNVEVNLGSVLENVFAQQLQVNGFPLRYYNSKRYGEVDFIISRGRRIIPIEIKSGKDYQTHSALSRMLSVQEWELDEAVVFSRLNVQHCGPIKYLPWYMVSFIVPEESASGKCPVIDLAALKNLALGSTSQE